MSAIRPIVIGVAIRDDCVLAVEGFDAHKRQQFYRPPGGGIEFGETSEQALRREFQEELDVELVSMGYLGALENVFAYEGEPGHEVVLVHRVELGAGVRFTGDTVAGVESDDTSFTARWLPLEAVRNGEAILYPDGLLDLLDGARQRAERTQIFPEASIETPRLLLRPHRAQDAPDVALACRDELTQRWLPLPHPYTDEDAVAWCTEMAPRFRLSGEGIEWAAIRRADGRLIGSFGLKRTDWRGRASEIGYWVAPWARGEGLAVEAVTAIARWLLLEQGFERLGQRAAPGNLASQRVAEKAGFTREGVARNAGFTNAGRVDLVVHSLTRSDLDQRAAQPQGEEVTSP
jgi:RimJ/RimL family protein N-acetyltransferase